MEVRLVAAGEEEACNAFHNRFHLENRTLLQWRWEFASNPFGRTSIPYAVVRDGGNIVGTQAFIPIRMIDRNGIYWTAKSEETLVDPDCRGQGLFEKMYELLFRYAEEQSFAYIWGFSPAIKAFTRLGFTVPGVTQQLFIPFSSRSVSTMLTKQRGGETGSARAQMKSHIIRLGSVAARMISVAKITLTNRRLPSGLQIRTMAESNPQIGILCQQFIEQWGGTTIYRDADYMRWRLFENPYVRGIVRGIYERDQLLGWVVYTLGDDGLGYLVDIMVGCDATRYEPSNLVRALLLDAVLGTRNMGATGIRGWRVNEHPFDRLVCKTARQIGFYHIKHGHAMVKYDCPAARARVAHEKFDDWYVTRIYTEGVLS